MQFCIKVESGVVEDHQDALENIVGQEKIIYQLSRWALLHNTTRDSNLQTPLHIITYK